MANRRTTLAERLSWALREAGITQADLSRRAGISQPTLHGLLSGRYKRSRFAGELARALGVSASWLATGAGSAYSNLSAEAMSLAAQWDALPPEAQREVASYLEYVRARMADPHSRAEAGAPPATQRTKA